MTLIIGIKCSDGIVMGADSAQTMMGLMQQPTKKLAILGEDFVIGSAGSGHVAHQLRWAIEAIITGGTFQPNDMKSATELLRQCMLPVVHKNYSDIHAMRQVSATPHTLQDPVTESLVALPISGQPRLFQFSQTCSPIETTDHICFSSLGSGVFPANPVLSLLQRMWWKNVQPSLAEGIFATVWVLDHAIRTSSGGVADPKQIVTLTRDKDAWVAKEFTQEELEEHHEMIVHVEQKLGDTLRNVLKAATDIEPPPQAPEVCAPVTKE